MAAMCSFIYVDGEGCPNKATPTGLCAAHAAKKPGLHKLCGFNIRGRTCPRRIQSASQFCAAHRHVCEELVPDGEICGATLTTEKRIQDKRCGTHKTDRVKTALNELPKCRQCASTLRTQIRRALGICAKCQKANNPAPRCRICKGQLRTQKYKDLGVCVHCEAKQEKINAELDAELDAILEEFQE